MKDYIDKSVVILFKDNGELPGISTIRIKLDYVFRSYIGNKIYVYYYDENSKKNVYKKYIRKNVKMDILNLILNITVHILCLQINLIANIYLNQKNL